MRQRHRNQDHDHQHRDGQADVHDGAQHIVYPAAAVTGNQTDHQADRGSDEAGDQADDQRGPGAVDQIGDDALALIVGAEDEGAAALWLLVQPADGGIRVGRHDQWSDQPDQDDEGDQYGSHPKPRTQST